MKAHLFKIVFSFMAIVVFLVVAVNSIAVPQSIGFGPSITEYKNQYIGNGIFKETITLENPITIDAQIVTLITTGPHDQKGHWHGEVNEEVIYPHLQRQISIRTGTYFHGKRHGKFKLNDLEIGKISYECYNMGKVVSCDGNLVSNIAYSRAGLTAFQILEQKFPWFTRSYVFYDEKQKDSLKFYMTAIEKKLNTYTLNASNFEKYYSEVIGSDSIIRSFGNISNWYQLSGRFASGENEAKDFEFRRAVIERHTTTKIPVADIIQVRYPYLKDQLEKEFGVNSAAFKTFCTEFDNKMDKKINIPVSDPFFIDSLDNWMSQIFTDYLNDDNLTYRKIKVLLSQSLISGNRYDVSPQRLVSEYLESSLTDTLPVHEAILIKLFTKVLEVDAVKLSIKEACLTAQKVPLLPEIVTNILSENTEGVKVRGLIVFDGNDPITKSGIVWDTVYNPELTPNNIINTGNKYDYAADIKGLVKGKRYFVRSYAVNKAGTAYGNTIEFIAGSVSSSLDTKLNAIDWKVYPNPADDQIRIILKESIPVVDISVYSITGHKVFQNRYRQTEEIKIASGDWPAGTYTIVLNGSNIRQTKRAVIQR